MRIVSASRLIPAAPEQIFALLRDPAKHALIDGSDTVQGPGGETTMASQQLELGSKFGMKMTFGPLPYRITNEVVEFEQDRLIAWRHFGHHIWRYELEPVDGGDATTVTESFDWETSRFPPLYEWVGYPEQHKKNIAKTLERLEEHFAKT